MATVVPVSIFVVCVCVYAYVCLNLALQDYAFIKRRCVCTIKVELSVVIKCYVIHAVWCTILVQSDSLCNNTTEQLREKPSGSDLPCWKWKVPYFCQTCMRYVHIHTLWTENMSSYFLESVWKTNLSDATESTPRDIPRMCVFLKKNFLSKL